MMDNLSVEPDRSNPRPQELGRGSRVLVAAVVVSSVALLIVNLNVTLSNHRAATKIQQLEEKLETLSAFDQRIGNLLQQFNNGVQNRLERQNYDLQGWFSDVHRRMDDLEGNWRRPQSDPAAANEQETVLRALGLSGALLTPPKPEVLNAPAFLQGDTAGARRTPMPAEPGPASSSYERIETDDGKVFYRRME